MVIGWLIKMPSAKQIKARKEFAKRVKRGDFKKAIAKPKKLTLKEAIEFKQKGFEKHHQIHDLNPYIPKRKTTKPKAVDPKDYGTSKDIHQIPQGMLDELFQSKVRGFPFFSYTGIRDYLLMGNDSLMLKPIPPNPNQISAIQINYDKGADGFHIVFYKGNDRVETTETLYVGDLADTIVQKMGVS